MVGTVADEPTEVIKEETARQAVILLFSVAGAVATVAAMRALNSPDSWKTTKMATARALESFAQKQAQYWANLADRASRWYERERL